MTSVPFDHNGTPLNLSFTWGVFETLHATWGDDYQANLASLFVGDVTHLRLVASLAASHDFTPDTILPVQKTINALYRAYELGWSGRDVGPGPEPVEGEAESTGKKPKRLGIFSILTLRRG